jgi:glycerol-3-phosphate dehydrogenase
MFDVGIIGAGGIVGCAIARELAGRGLSVAGIEKHPTVCQETSGLNSRVIHSGFHEIPGTLKASLAREGSQLMIRYAEEHGIKLLRTGMLIAIPYGGIRAGLWREADALWNLWRQGRRQGVAFQFVLTGGGIRHIAPIQALGGIFIPSVCVVDVEALVESLVRDAKDAGAQFFYNSEVVGLDIKASHHVVHTTQGALETRTLINSGGLSAHEISQMAGGPKYNVEFIRGDYYELKGGIERWGIRTLVYPAMPPHSRSKGIHFGPRTDGRLYLGPSATPASQPAPKSVFLEAARKFLPELHDDDMAWAYSGVRPKLPAPNGSSDFTIRLERSTPPLINLIGIDSPGLSASMGIARYVSEKVPWHDTKEATGDC